jgi:hypothetical protein
VAGISHGIARGDATTGGGALKSVLRWLKFRGIYYPCLADKKRLEGAQIFSELRFFRPTEFRVIGFHGVVSGWGDQGQAIFPPKFF